MTYSAIFIIIITLGIIIGGIMVLKKSANKFNLSDKQLKDIKQRNIEQDKKDNAQ